MALPASGGTVTSATFAATLLRGWTLIAALALASAVAMLTVLHLLAPFDPLSDPLSRYAFADPVGGMLVASLLALALGVIAVRRALATGLTLGPFTSWLTGATAAGLVGAALFPASFPGHIDPVSGRIHQYASVVGFLCLPAIGVSVLCGLNAVPALARARAVLVRLLATAAVALVLFGLSYLTDLLPPGPARWALDMVPPVGITQRVVLLADLGVLLALLVLAYRTAYLVRHASAATFVRTNGEERAATAPARKPVPLAAPMAGDGAFAGLAGQSELLAVGMSARETVSGPVSRTS
jgi:hypothetical protein